VTVGGGSVSSGSLTLNHPQVSGGSLSFGSSSGAAIHSVTTTTLGVTFNGQVYRFAVGSDGKISINGKPITFISFDSSKYPASGGWKKFITGGAKFLFNLHGANGQPQIIPIQEIAIPVHLNKGQVLTFKYTNEGNLYIGGNQVLMRISTNSHYPTAAGYKMFVYKGHKFFMQTANGQIQIIPLVQQSAQLTVEINGTPYVFTPMANGRLSIGGTELQMSASTYSKYPATLGWKTFVYNGMTFYYAIIDGHYKLVHVTKQSASMIHVNANGHPYDFGISEGGQLTLKGVPVKLSDSTASGRFSAANGWKMFTHDEIVFFFSTTGGQYQIVAVPPKPFHLTIGTTSYNFVLDAFGKLKHNGAPITLSTSTGPDYPGWKTWTLDGINFFLHNGANGKVDIKIKKQTKDAAKETDMKE
jgi:hypothetical protein